MKLFVAAVYMDYTEKKSGGKRHDVMQVAKRCHFGKDVVIEVEGELMANDHILRPEEMNLNRAQPRGSGSICMYDKDLFVLYAL